MGWMPPNPGLRRAPRRSSYTPTEANRANLCQNPAHMSPSADGGPRSTGSLVDVLDRVLDKGLVVAGDIRVSLADVELLTIRIRLLVCSIDKAEEIGLDWWKGDPELSSGIRHLTAENRELRERVRALELEQLPPAPAPRARRSATQDKSTKKR